MNVFRILGIGLTVASVASCGDSNSAAPQDGRSQSSSGSVSAGSGSSSGVTAGSAGAGSGSSSGVATGGAGSAETGASTASTSDAALPLGPDAAAGDDDARATAPSGDASIDAHAGPSGRVEDANSAEGGVGPDATTVKDAGAAADSGGTQGSSGNGALHVNGNVLNDGDGKLVIARGPELVVRWGVYSGVTANNVDVAWEGGSNNNVGSATVREVGKTNANAMRIFGGIGDGLDPILNTAIVEQKMFVGVGRVDWTNAQMKATLDKYGKYVWIHPRGEFTYRDANQWRTEALAAVKFIRGLGYKQAIEIGTTGYGQTWSTIQMYGQEVAESDPLKNTFFLLQLYSELANAIPQTLTQIAAFPYPVTVDACLFTSTYGNTPDTYKQVWSQSFAKNFSSMYWDWWGDGTGADMAPSGTFAGMGPIGQYIVNQGAAALKNTVKTPFLLNATVP